jgi:hypothetical protein
MDRSKSGNIPKRFTVNGFDGSSKKSLPEVRRDKGCNREEI